MNFLSFGAGAIGSYIGGSLALNGHRLVFLERLDAAEELRKQGLCLSIDGEDRRVANVETAATLDEALIKGPYDAAFFALKSFDTTSALTGFAPHIAHMPPIFCLQNGVENEEKIAAVLGADRVIPGTVTSAVARRGIGNIVLERLRGMGVARGFPLSEQLAATLSAAGLNARLYPSGSAMKWSKLLTNLLANATSAILNMTPAEIYAHPGLFRLEKAQMSEALAVMRAQNIDVVDLPGTPVNLLVFALTSLPASLGRLGLRRGVGGGRGGKMPSFHIDLYQGRGQSEVDALNGAVVRAGERLGIPTPVNRLLRDTLLALTNGEIPLETYHHRPDLLLHQSGL